MAKGKWVSVKYVGGWRDGSIRVFWEEEICGVKVSIPKEYADDENSMRQIKYLIRLGSRLTGKENMKHCSVDISCGIVSLRPYFAFLDSAKKNFCENVKKYKKSKYRGDMVFDMKLGFSWGNGEKDIVDPKERSAKFPSIGEYGVMGGDLW